MSGLRKRKKLNSAYLVTFKNKKNSKLETRIVSKTVCKLRKE